MQNFSSTSQEVLLSNKKGVEHYKVGEYKQAVDHFQGMVEYWRKKIKTSPREEIEKNLAPSLFNLGSAELELGEFKQAFTDLREAATLEKDNKRYARRCKKAYLHLLFSNQLMSRFQPGSGSKISQTTLDVGYKKNFISLFPAFTGNFMDFVNTIEQLPQTKKYHIVSLGCGLAEEIYMLMNLLGEQLFDKIKYVGIDTIFDIEKSGREKSSVGLAMAEIYRKVGYKNIEFSGIDAQESGAVKNLLGCKTDLIIIRHPEVTSHIGKPIFANIMRNTVPAISRTDGKTRIFISTYFPNELGFTLQYLANNSTSPEKVDALVLDEAIYNNGIIEKGAREEMLCCDKYSRLTTFPLKTLQLEKESKSKLVAAKVPIRQPKEKLLEDFPQRTISRISVCDKVMGFFRDPIIVITLAIAAVGAMREIAARVATDESETPKSGL